MFMFFRDRSAATGSVGAAAVDECPTVPGRECCRRVHICVSVRSPWRSTTHGATRRYTGASSPCASAPDGDHAQHCPSRTPRARVYCGFRWRQFVAARTAEVSCEQRKRDGKSLCRVSAFVQYAGERIRADSEEGVVVHQERHVVRPCERSSPPAACQAQDAGAG